jgi:hypothetical protein
LRIVLRIGNGYGLMESLRVCGLGKFVESSRVRVLKVLGKFEGVG